MKSIGSRSSWIMWIIPTVFYALVYILRVAPGILKSDIMNHYGIDDFKFGLIPAFYYAGYASMQIPVSFAMDRFRLNRVMSCLMFITGFGLMLLSRSPLFPLALVGCFIVGAGTTVSVLGSSNVINSSFPKNYYSFMFGLTLTFGFLSGACAGKLLSASMDYYNWQELYGFATGFCLVLAMAAFTLIKTPATHKKLDVSLPTALTFIVKNKFIVLLAICGGFMTAPVQGFADAWGPGFLYKTMGFEESTAILINSMCLLGYGVGAPIIGRLAQKYDVLKESLIACGLVMALSFLMVLFIPNLSSTTIGLLLFLAGMGSSFPTLTFAIILRRSKREFNTISIGIANMILMIFGSIYHTLIGAFYKASPLLGISIVPLGLIVGTTGTILLFRKN
jgi:sugar phosphate permease